MENIPLAAHDTQMARMTRIIKWLIIGWVLTCTLFIGTLWSMQTDTVTTTETVSQEGGEGGTNMYAGDDMSIGETDSNQDNGKENNHL